MRKCFAGGGEGCSKRRKVEKYIGSRKNYLAFISGHVQHSNDSRNYCMLKGTILPFCEEKRERKKHNFVE